MKLVLAIVSNDDATKVSNALIRNHFYMTKLSTTGGFLRAGNTTLIVGVEEEKVDEVIAIIKEEASQRTEVIHSASSMQDGEAAFPLEISVGGATIFVLDVDQFMKV